MEKISADFHELDSSIIFEDNDFLALNKPAGWVVNRSTTYAGATVQDWVQSYLHLSSDVTPSVSPAGQDVSEYGTPEEIFVQRGGIAHRLDKETSGILLIAKRPEMLVELLRQFKAREVHKTYTALVHGKVDPSEGIIRLPMGRSQQDRTKYAVTADGKLAESHYQVLELFPGLPKGISPRKGKSYQGFSLVSVQPKTGRTHQIRVHMAAIHHPVVGDIVYAGKKRISLDQKWCPRHFLHAQEIVFSHPRTHETLTITAPLAEDLHKVLELFR